MFDRLLKLEDKAPHQRTGISVRATHGKGAACLA
jgi:hypothetical protein